MVLIWRLLFRVVGRVVPFGAMRRLARPLAWCFYQLGLRRSVTLANLRLAFPGLAQPALNQLARRSFASTLTTLLELLPLRYLTNAQLSRVLKVNNLELLSPEKNGRGALLLSAHFGNWELLAFGTAAIAGMPFNIIVKPQRDAGETDQTRIARGNRVIPYERGALESARLLNNGGVVALLADQSATTSDHLTTMFGIPTWTFSTPARLALRFRPRVVVGFAVRQPDGSYQAELQELRHDDLPDTPEGAAQFTQRYVDCLQSAIRQHPEQWMWQHRKWKHTAGVKYE
ncbi:MAG: lysophospholipid acyltransferase family protein [Chlorobi bacterium]|nr:lysophospholipid acyltransferase family protein [Chlorobiota bacterium]